MPRVPKLKGFVPLHTSIPSEINKAIDIFAATTGISKASLIRSALANELVRLGCLPDYALNHVTFTTKPTHK
jgi:hypothetical protein